MESSRSWSQAKGMFMGVACEWLMISDILCSVGYEPAEFIGVSEVMGMICACTVFIHVCV